MKVSLSWLKEYVDLSQSPEEIADALTLAGLEAEGMEMRGEDVILEVGLTPNLGHCMSMIGMARELSAILGAPLTKKAVALSEEGGETSELKSVRIEDREQCFRYAVRAALGIRVGPSPAWLVERLESAGLRSVNVVVDVGNYVMLATGQPLHMFDADKLEANELVVRAANGDGKMVTLDGEEREIADGLLLIADGKRPVAVAGVMGEMDSSVSDETTNILIEAAAFSPSAVRKSVKALGLRSESSTRFERGIDPLGVVDALDYAAMLLKELAGGVVTRGAVDAVASEFQRVELSMSKARCNKLLGVHLSGGEMEELLGRLEIEILEEETDEIRVAVPSYRNDLRSEIDLIEEVGRMYGFNNIPRGIPRHASSSITHSPLYLLEEEAREKLVGMGLQELLTCDLISPAQAAMTGASELISVMHPASVDQSVLRPSLLSGLLEVVKFNLDRQNMTLAGFEVGHIHFRRDGKAVDEPMAAIVLTGREFPYHHEYKPKDVDFFDLKGHVEDFFEAFGIWNLHTEPSHLKALHPGRQARMKVGDCTPGSFGEVHPRILKEMGISQRVYYAEISLLDLQSLRKGDEKVLNPSAFPGSERDWTLGLDEGVAIGPILEGANQIESPILEGIYLLDLYKSEKIGKNRKNATFRFRYRDPNKTVEFQEVEEEHKRITQLIAENIKDGVG